MNTTPSNDMEDILKLMNQPGMPVVLDEEFKRIMDARGTPQSEDSVDQIPDEQAAGREAILDGAKECVLKNRQSTYGDLEDSFGLTAKYWSAHLGTEVSATDVAVLMGLLKVARIKTSPDHKDNWIDLAGYAACGGEIALNQKG